MHRVINSIQVVMMSRLTLNLHKNMDHQRDLTAQPEAFIHPNIRMRGLELTPSAQRKMSERSGDWYRSHIR